MKILNAILLLGIAAMIVYLICPKYEIYQTEKDGTVTYTYRFNKITGTLDFLEPMKGWKKNVIPLCPLKKY